MRYIITLLVMSSLTSTGLPETGLVRSSDPEAKLVTTYAQPVGPVPAGPVIRTPEHRDVIAWALDRFEQAGLEIGPVSIGVYDSDTPCKGHRGLQNGSGIHVCAMHDNPMVQDVWRRHTLLHELAHQWSETSLSDAQKEAFSASRALSVWFDRETDWHLRGTEHAAEIITWGLADWAVSIHVWIDDRNCADLAAGFRLLTGSSPLTGFTDYCD